MIIIRKLIIILLVALTFLVYSCKSEKGIVVEKRKFNSEWKFKLLQEGEQENGFMDKTFNDQEWEDARIPHTPKLEPMIVNDQWQGTCWYRKTFDLPEELKGKKLFLRFEGAMNIAEVWINGEKKIKHHGGYLPFVVDFSNEAIWAGENVVAVRLDNRDNPTTGPKPLKILDFNTYGGIYRNVWLVAKAPLHITDPIFADKKAGGGVFVSYPEVSKEKAKIKIQTHVINENNKAERFYIRNTLYRNGAPILFALGDSNYLEVNQDAEYVTEIEVVNPELWSPQHPNLYTLETELLVDGNTIDKEVTRIGIKKMEFKGQDFYLNGEKTFLRGVNRHQEYPFIGYALPDNAQYRDAKKIKDAGFDYVRLSHYPHSNAFMDACDELGIMTVDAILGWQYFSEDSAFQKHVFQTARDLIRRDRNRASVLAWEVSLNESWMPEYFIDSLHRIAHEEYPGDQCFSAGWQEYGYDIYLQARQHRLTHYNQDLKKPYIVSEYGDWEYYAMNAGLNQNSWGDLLQVERSSRQLRTSGEKRLLQQAKNIQEAHNDNLNTPAFADGYWVMFDYNRGYANDLEASGIMDIFRIPKPAYYFFQSQRNANDPNGKPMVYIASNWDDDSQLDIFVYSNCEEVELFLNGNSVEKKQPSAGRISKNLNHAPFVFEFGKFTPGELKAVGYIDGEIVAEHVVKTPGKVHHIEVEVDKGGKVISTGDVVFVYIKMLDENDTLVPTNDGEIELTIEEGASVLNVGPIKVESGIATALIKTGNKRGTVNMKAVFGELVAEAYVVIN